MFILVYILNLEDYTGEEPFHHWMDAKRIKQVILSF